MPLGSKYKILEIFLPSFVALLVGIGGTTWFGDWFKNYIRPVDPPITIERAVVYAKILFFKDKKAGENPIIKKTLSLAGGEVTRDEDLYDEGLYLRAYYFRKPHPDKLSFEAHSSGIVDITSILPNAASFETHLYRQSGYKRLNHTVDVRNTDYVLTAYHYYNGYQFNEKANKYESDGGVHFPYPVDQAIIIFDFSAIQQEGGRQDHQFRVIGNPKLWIRKPGDNTPTPLKVIFANGVLTSETITDIPQGAHIYCDWEWDTEKVTLTTNTTAATQN